MLKLTTSRSSCGASCALLSYAAEFDDVQGVVAEGTPPRDLGDTYSQSTDPSSDEDGDTADKHDDPVSGTAAWDRHASAHTSPGAFAQPAQQHQALEEQPSVTLDTDNDPADQADMQEGELHTIHCLIVLVLLDVCPSTLFV